MDPDIESLVKKRREQGYSVDRVYEILRVLERLQGVYSISITIGGYTYTPDDKWGNIRDALKTELKVEYDTLISMLKQ